MNDCSTPLALCERELKLSRYPKLPGIGYEKYVRKLSLLSRKVKQNTA